MDEMKIKLSTKFMRGIIAKLVSKAVSKKLGCDVSIQINEIEAETTDGKVHLHLNVDGEMNNDEFMKLIKTIGLD
jgi:hypothetical protein